MGRKYPFVGREVEPEDMGVRWVVEYLDFPGITGGGDTLEEALAIGNEAIEMYIEVLQEDGKKIPEPVDMSVNGRVTLRLPRTLHLKAIEMSNQEGVSLNSFITDSLAQRIYSSSATTIHSEITSSEISYFDNFKKIINYEFDWITKNYNKFSDNQMILGSPKSIECDKEEVQNYAFTS